MADSEQSSKMRKEICERVWREQEYLANDMVIREAAKAYKAIESGFEAGWLAQGSRRDGLAWKRGCRIRTQF